MKPSENTESAEDDDRFPKLWLELREHNVSANDQFHLHLWLSTREAEMRLAQSASRVVGTQTNAAQIAASEQLEKAATLIVDQFDFLNQLSLLDHSLFQAYRSLRQVGVDTQSVTIVEWSEEWSTFRDRIRSDMAILSQVSQQTRASLRERGGRKGKPVNDWRNELFVELFRRLTVVLTGSQIYVAELAMHLWNIYFPNEKINDEGSALKIVQRYRRRKLSGHKA